MDKLFKKIEENFPKELKDKVIVYDIDINGNKIAFDLEVDEKKKLLKVWIFSRNNPNLLNTIKEKAIKVEKISF